MLAEGLAVFPRRIGSSAPRPIGITTLYKTLLNCKYIAVKEPNEPCLVAIGEPLVHCDPQAS